MKKRLLIGLIGLMVIGAGISVFAANTAQWVNVTARVEKEVEVNCVTPVAGGNPIVRPAGCAYGTTYPETANELNVEVNASNSFVNNHSDGLSGVRFDVLWECKLVHEDQLATGPTGTNPCRENLPSAAAPGGPDFCLDATTGEYGPCNPLHLDGNIRDYITIQESDHCLDTTLGEPGAGFSDGGPAKLKWLGSGVVDDLSNPKCFYHLTFLAPACAGHVNPNTDPHTPRTVVCNEVTSNPDPQKWDRWSLLGDTFKIQVYGFTTES
jgi:hypothetical protein